MLLPHVKKAADLVTPKEATSKGFVDQAREKASMAEAHVREVLRFRKAVAAVSSPTQLVGIKSVRGALLASVGLSEKAIANLLAKDQELVLKEVLGSLYREAGHTWKEELVIRLALTRGDSLGGSSRNLAGAKAKQQFAASVQEALAGRKLTAKLEVAEGATKKVVSIAWDDRLIVFDRKPTIVGKNIDVIMLEDEHTSPVGSLLETKGCYVACGELKGGIDPAGADEHWKTANSALQRIRSSFGLKGPALFFAAAAIEKSMAEEIISQLRTNQLNFGANLTNSQQLRDLANWLISL